MIGFFQAIRRRTPLGWLQLSHSKSRLLVALSGIAFADVLIFMQLGFQNALYDSNTRLNRAFIADIILISPQSQSMQNMSTFTRRRILQAADVPGVKSAEAIYVGLVTWKNPQTKSKTTVQAIAFNPEKPALNISEINAQLDTIKLPDTFLFDRGAKGDYDQVFSQINAGKNVSTEIDKRTINISGLFQLGASFAADGTLVSSDENFLRIFPRRKAGSINLGLISVQPGYEIEQVVAALKSHLQANPDVKVLTLPEYIKFEEDYWKKSTAIGFIFSIGVSMGFIVGVIIVYQVLSTDVNSHLREYATFKAMGYQNIYLLGIIVEEAIILAVLGFIPGFIVPLGLYQLTRNATNLPIYMTLARALTVFLMTVIMCTLSGTVATARLQSADPADMF
ncbi:ABC transporter permease DevC [Dolichospermum sp. ST_con]|nr:ABC transporter permease DevC [Dolichospermum sp. ST_con]MDD1419977.1 ABC transporter permease DevC [Dolichospermum sp. ST_sed1]MDD1424813.1 ABC transporter permease DevC [Dolichospermum sp. ST_sed9]MDD1431313.1 ABC transporter permease DevC [Dolichospermum sp. ST_sed6]MDD1440719.1 ABC transporter permease DevC [Dolichospermum sp. ST_sed3]MDD1445554.1 ABC transporter permease DevC [Dolichospermum sp. ST_sed8]MDD1454859.1 ABC transporter permease DevC [Dolichospermum sp. ST_sed7]MDD1460714